MAARPYRQPLGPAVVVSAGFVIVGNAAKAPFRTFLAGSDVTLSVAFPPAWQTSGFRSTEGFCLTAVVCGSPNTMRPWYLAAASDRTNA